MIAFRLAPAVSATVLLAALSGPALADVTAQQVWDDWKAQLGVVGEGAVTIGGESRSGDALTVTDIGFASTAEDGTTVTGTLAELVFTDNGDGTVAVTMSEEYPLLVTTPADAATGSPASEIALALRQTGLTMTVSGAPGALAYDLAAARYALELDRLTRDGVAVAAEGLLALNDLSGTYTSTTAALREVVYDLRAASLDLLMDIPSPEDGSQVMLSGQVDAVTTQARVTMPLDVADPERVMMDGFAIEGGYATGPGRYILESTDASGPTSGSLTTRSGRMSVRADKDAVAYSGQATGVALDVTGAALPIPVQATLAQYGFNFEMPLSRTSTPAPWALGLNLADLALNEEAWGLFDPQGLLPRDLATLKVDLTGTATMLFDLMDPSQAEAVEAAEMPAQVESATLNDLDLSFGGARVTGTGDFTFDNADLTTFPGFPRPTGTLDLRLNGVNGLLDDLVALGLLPADQVMGPRMMLGMLARSVGPDQLVTRIEATPDGQLLANGQRLQ
ncbi:DUF2125 domain-containing protein [Rubellimicrobium aerolatum]|uniref:DUF2125 domain-containing protein n=1 Tax=Rubellimicrobium aerolatum TaxID=490979 RepID=A0ABW0SAJ6_9RHOB|nr:DUF2125 domain-containing protein [Rubellimicrobium aerolatum]MBP1805282.1 hypothetical protein [Rubellimicrobium aerolatum]